MVPYLEIPPIHLWQSISIAPFGTLLIIACAAGYIASRRHAKRIGIDQDVIAQIAGFVFVPAFLTSHWTAMLLYYPQELFRAPLAHILQVSPMSSYGGFLGGALGAAVYFRIKNQTRTWEYFDALTVGGTAAWFFGRLGCTLAHDHPGEKSTFFLPYNYLMDHGMTWVFMSGVWR